MENTKKNLFKNKTFLIIAGIVGVLAIIGIVLLVLMMTVWAKPSKADFEAAVKAGEKIRDVEVSPLLQDYLYAVQDEADKNQSFEKIIEATSGDRKKVEDAVKSRLDGRKPLQESRVLRNEEVKKTYDTYVAKETKFSKYVTDYMNTYPSFQSTTNTCLDVFAITKQATTNDTYAPLHKKAAEDCLKDLDRLAKSEIKAFSDYAKEFSRIIKARQTAFDKLADGSMSEAEVSREIRTLGRDVSKNDPTPALKKYIEESRFDGELTKLIDLLKKKANETK